jgi:hypothetical protein
VLRHQLGQNLVFRLDLFLQVCNPLLVSGMVRWPFLLEGSSPVLEEFLLPAVKDRRLKSSSHNFEMGSFSSKCRLRMATFSSGAYSFRCFFMRSLLYLTGRTPSPFPTEPEHMQLLDRPNIRHLRDQAKTLLRFGTAPNSC